jgi:H+-transporting ATPase
MEKYGKNEIPEEKVPLWKIYVKQYIGVMPFMIEVSVKRRRGLSSAFLPFVRLSCPILFRAFAGAHERWWKNRARGQAACLLAAILKDWADFGIILVVLLVNTTLGFYEEIKAQAR